MSTSNHSLFEISHDKEECIIGVVYVIVASLVFPIYIPIIYIIRTTKELKNNISYKLINCMNLSDLMQSMGHVLTGIFIVFPFFTEKIYSFVILVGYTSNCLWNSSFVFIAVLALTRLGVNFFHLKAKEWTIWMKLLMFIGCSYMFTVWLMGCIVFCFQLDTVNWSYNMVVPLSAFLSEQELYFCFSILIFSFCSYLLIIWNIYWQKRKAQSSASHRIEIAILTQATVLTTYMGAIMVLWHNAERWFTMNNMTLSLLNGSWIMFSHLNSSFLLITNKTIRKSFLSICKSQVSRNQNPKLSRNSVFVTKQTVMML